MVAGVSAGIARHLDIDPVLVRILFGVLIFAGGAGLILYGAAWLLLPPDDGRSIAADWFRLDDSAEKVRVAGLVIAGVVAVLSAVGDGGWGSGGWGSGGAPWILLPLALLFYLFVVRPRRRREARAATTATEDARQQPVSQTVHDGVQTITYRLPPERRSWALTVLALSVTAIAVAITRLVADSRGGTPWTTYVAIALTVVAAAVLLSTFIGDGGPLILLGLLLAVVLGLGTLLPDTRIGVQQVTPISASDVARTYDHGVGVLELDLTEVTDPDALLGRTLSLEGGVGQVRVIVPNGLNAAVDTHLGVGEVAVFDRTVNGTDNRLDTAAAPGRALTLSIDQKVGNIEVIRQ
jgi:phage shock protein PspC (stress-responsive transcriptional regulator)